MKLETIYPIIFMALTVIGAVLFVSIGLVDVFGVR